MLGEQDLFLSSFLSCLSGFLDLCSSSYWYYSTVKFLALQSRDEFVSTFSLSWALGNPLVWDWRWQRRGYYSLCCCSFMFWQLLSPAQPELARKTKVSFPFVPPPEALSLSKDPALTWLGLVKRSLPDRVSICSHCWAKLFLNSTGRPDGCWGGKGKRNTQDVLSKDWS